jgi:hypothetical protein
VPRRPSPATVRADVRDEQIVRLYARGHTAAEIADGLGCSPNLVYSVSSVGALPGAPGLPATVSARRPRSSLTSTGTAA